MDEGKILYLETSAIVAILKNETERQEFLDRIEQTKVCVTSIVSAFEASIAMSGLTGSCSAGLSEVLNFCD